MPARTTAVLLALLSCTAAPWASAADEPAVPPSVKWYEESRGGNKTGYRRVVWAPSTWEGRNTVRDTTTVVTRTQRDMAGAKDQFSVTVTTELERSEDGLLWWQRQRAEEAGHVTTHELTWTGSGYVSVTRVGDLPEKRIEVALAEPVHVDAEALLGEKARRGTLEPGQRHDIRQLDLRAREAKTEEVRVVGRDTLQDGEGVAVPTVALLQRDPETGSEVLLWIDEQGTFVQARVGAFLIRRTSQEKAEEMPVEPAEYSITTPAAPRLERIFSADLLRIDVHVRADEHRQFPEFPTSPWSRVVGVDGAEGAARVVHMELRRHDRPEASAQLPIADPVFERQLESSALMQTGHELVRSTVTEVLGEEREARRAAALLARFVYTALRKQSSDVGQADAVQILRERCGDCSEHALLYVTLCRAAGIPARRCSGYVCIGGIWGSHAWAEIWTGAWIGADPTTGEVGNAARYVFYGYPDEPGSHPDVVSSRAAERIRIVTTRLEEGPAGFDLLDEDQHRIYDAAGRRYLHVLVGLEARDVPEDWQVELSHDRVMRIRGPAFQAQLVAQADQGSDIDSLGRGSRGTRTTFAGAPALLRQSGPTRAYLVFSRRRILQVRVSDATPEDVAALERVLAPTFADPPLPWHAPAPAAGEPAVPPSPDHDK